MIPDDRTTRILVAALAVSLVACLSAFARRSEQDGGGRHSVSSTGHSGPSHGGSASVLSINAGSFGHGHFLPNDRSFIPRERFFGFFGFDSFPTMNYLDYARTYPYALLNPKAEASEGSPWDTEEFEEAVGQADNYWLISLYNDTIILAQDYWLEGSILHYVTRMGEKSSVDLSKVDVKLTRELNRGHGREFTLPRAKPGPPPQPRDY